jgi:hypothetical protein
VAIENLKNYLSSRFAGELTLSMLSRTEPRQRSDTKAKSLWRRHEILQFRPHVERYGAFCESFATDKYINDARPPIQKAAIPCNIVNQRYGSGPQPFNLNRDLYMHACLQCFDKIGRGMNSWRDYWTLGHHDRNRTPAAPKKGFKGIMCKSKLIRKIQYARGISIVHPHTHFMDKAFHLQPTFLFADKPHRMQSEFALP